MSLYRFLFITCVMLGMFNMAFAEEVPIATDTRVKTLVHNPNEVYQLKMNYDLVQISRYF